MSNVKKELEKTTGVKVINVRPNGVDGHIIELHYDGDSYAPPIGYTIRAVGRLSDGLFLIIEKIKNK